MTKDRMQELALTVWHYYALPGAPYLEWRPVANAEARKHVAEAQQIIWALIKSHRPMTHQLVQAFPGLDVSHLDWLLLRHDSMLRGPVYKAKFLLVREAVSKATAERFPLAA